MVFYNKNYSGKDVIIIIIIIRDKGHTDANKLPGLVTAKKIPEEISEGPH